MGRAGLGASCHQKPGLSLQKPPQQNPEKSRTSPMEALHCSATDQPLSVSPLGVNWVIEIGAGAEWRLQRVRRRIELPPGGAVVGSVPALVVSAVEAGKGGA